MTLIQDKELLQDYHRAIENEWIETNGLGGYASSTVIGCNTRRYHGLLIAAITPPTERMVLVSKLDETIVFNGERFELGCNNYGDAISPTGNHYLTSFTKNLFPESIYEAHDVQLKKSIVMLHDENTTLVVYEVLKSSAPFVLEFNALIASRNYHELLTETDVISQTISFESGMLSLKMNADSPEIFIHLNECSFNHAPDWYRHFEYAAEKERGQDYREDLFSPGTFSITLTEGQKITVLISTAPTEGRNANELLEKEMHRRHSITASAKGIEVMQQLLLAADQFVVQRDEDLKTIIAGYHWFTDWSRDTMIALTGLCLITDRLKDAKKILLSFAKNISNGMLPNRFQDHHLPPEYNTADGTLWYFIAINNYLEAGGSKKFVLNEMLPVLTEIIEWHFKGTRFNIHVADDQLLFAGEAGTQLTWMDAKVNDWVVTPRIGKAVEINALWYNALRIYARLLKLNGNKELSERFRKKAKFTKKKFIEIFWNEELLYLYDVVNDDIKDASLRPNQLLALGLSYPLIKGKKAKKILDVVKEKLLTPFGLRSLSPDDENYKGTYDGNIVQRDDAYHQGTVWSWLIGPYIDALFHCYGKAAKPEAQQAIHQLLLHLNNAGIGSISEIFDGDAPHKPRGCIAQAWSVAELLRVIRQYRLYDFKSNHEDFTIDK